MSEYFPKLKGLGINMKVELDLANYATKADLKDGAGVDTSNFHRGAGLAHLKSDADK